MSQSFREVKLSLYLTIVLSLSTTRKLIIIDRYFSTDVVVEFTDGSYPLVM